MIKGNEALSMQEAGKYVKEGEKGEELVKFIKDFSKVKPKDAEDLKKEILGLGMMKLRKENIVKIVEVMPENQEELNKVLTSVSLSEDEAAKVLDSVKRFR